MFTKPIGYKYNYYDNLNPIMYKRLCFNLINLV